MADKKIKIEEKKAGKTDNKKDGMVQLKRVLDLYRKFEDGQVINKYEEAERYGVSDRTIQRDIDDLRVYMQEKEGSTETIEYKRDKKGYMVVNSDEGALTNSEIFAVCKILLESRSMVREEMEPIIDKLDRFPTAEITGTDPEDGACIVSAEVYGPGYDMWLNGQKGVELISKTELASRVL